MALNQDWLQIMENQEQWKGKIRIPRCSCPQRPVLGRVERPESETDFEPLRNQCEPTLGTQILHTR